MKKLYWDLETEGLPAAEIEKLMPEFEAPGNIKDPVKIAAAIADKKASWLDGAALKAITGRIVAVTTAWDNNKPVMATGDEKDLIAGMEVFLLDAIGAGNAYAWNGSGFDLPFLCQRGAVYGMPLFRNLMNFRGRFNWNESFIDPKLVWSNYSPDHTGTSLKSVGLALGVGEKTGNGKDFAKLLKENRPEAEQYALMDIELLRGIVQRMGI